ncbi:MAG: MOSC N-terminal beta barrel domain-containing protein [Myxococcota bacterium]
MQPVVRSLAYYPVKGCAGIEVDELALDDEGPRFDREWMVVDEQGVFVTQRDTPALARVGVALDEDAGRLRLDFAGADAIDVPLDAEERGAPHRPSRVWLDVLDAVDQGDAVARWLTARLERPLRLVRKAREARREAPPRFAPWRAHTRFTDAFPLLVVGEGSLSALVERLGRPLEMRRFRPNVVVAGAPAHAEDEWRRIRVGDEHEGIELGFAKLCSRCAVPTVDPSTGVRDRAGEPLAALARYRTRELDHGDGQVERGVFFGANYVHAGPGRLRVGARVEVLA